MTFATSPLLVLRRAILSAKRPGLTEVETSMVSVACDRARRRPNLDRPRHEYPHRQERSSVPQGLSTMDAKTRFTDTVADYDRFRPDYPTALFDWMMRFVPLQPGDVVIDVGCGTGIASRQLAARGLKVIAVDPNPAMLSAAKSHTEDGITYIETDGERLDIPVEQCSGIVGGQSFHWLDLQAARGRFANLGASWVVPFWNLRRNATPFMEDYEALLRKWSPEYLEVAAEPRVETLQDQLMAHPFEFAHYQDLDRDALFGRVWSASYIRNVVQDQSAFNAELQTLFDRHESDGTVRLEYRTLALPFRP